MNPQRKLSRTRRLCRHRLGRYEARHLFAARQYRQTAVCRPPPSFRCDRAMGMLAPKALSGPARSGDAWRLPRVRSSTRGQKNDSLILFPVNPATLAKIREAFTPSHAKADPSDAEIALELLLCHRDKLKV